MEGVTDLEILRNVLARELETINEYTAMARQAQDPAVRSLLLHISRDEEEHVAECIQWISRLNPVMADFLSRPADHVPGGGPVQVSQSVAPVHVPPVVPAVPPPQVVSPVHVSPVVPAVPPPQVVSPVHVPPVVTAVPAPQVFNPPVMPAKPVVVGMAAPGGGQLLTRAGLTVGNLLNRPVGQE